MNRFRKESNRGRENAEGASRNLSIGIEGKNEPEPRRPIMETSRDLIDTEKPSEENPVFPIAQALFRGLLAIALAVFLSSFLVGFLILKLLNFSDRQVESLRSSIFLGIGASERGRSRSEGERTSQNLFPLGDHLWLLRPSPDEYLILKITNRGTQIERQFILQKFGAGYRILETRPVPGGFLFRGPDGELRWYPSGRLFREPPPGVPDPVQAMQMMNPSPTPQASGGGQRALPETAGRKR